MGEMLFHCCAKDYDIIYISNGKVKIFLDACHEFLEVCWSLCKAQRHFETLTLAKCELHAVLGMEDLSRGIWW